MNNRHKIFEPDLSDVLSDFPEYKIVKKYERMENDFIEAFINLMSDEMYLVPPSDAVRDNMLYVKLQELETRIKYKYNKKYKEKINEKHN